MRPLANYCHICQIDHRPKCPDSRSFTWPIGPLLEAVGSTKTTALMVRLGISASTAVTARTVGVTDKQADHWACKLGLHPSMIWPEWDRAALRPLDDLFVNGTGWRTSWLYHQHLQETPMPNTPQTDQRSDPDRLIWSRCWCDTTTVKVTPAEVRAGRTRSCGSPGCTSAAVTAEAG